MLDLEYLETQDYLDWIRSISEKHTHSQLEDPLKSKSKVRRIIQNK